jgi:hypothetical protein
MNPDDRVRTADGTLDERLRAACGALREASAAQVDAATGLREILHGARAVADDQAPPVGDPSGLAGATSPGPPGKRLFRASQRLALVVNLLLVVALSVVLVGVVSNRREPVPAAPVTTATTIVRQAQARAPVPASTLQTRTRVPEECLDAAELADEIISRFNRNQRDNTLALALRDYSVASQACRREATR